MSPRHRRRVAVAAVVTLIGLLGATAPVFVAEGVAASLGVLALSAILPAALLGVVASIWSGNDRDRARFSPGGTERS